MGNLSVQEQEPTAYLLDPDLTIDELYGDLSPEEQRLLQIDYLQSCLNPTISKDELLDS